MAEVKLQIPFDEIHGAIEKHGIISRQKKYRDEKGRIIHEGKQEAYAVSHPRDFKKNPPKGEELKHHNRWREACHRTSQILASGQPKSNRRWMRSSRRTVAFWSTSPKSSL